MKKTIFFLISLAVICALLVTFMGAKTLPGPLMTTKIVWIPPRTGLSGIADRLKEAGAITSSPLFLAHALFTFPRVSLKAGEYAIGPRDSIGVILSMMRAGRVHMRKITIPEGLTRAQIIDIVNNNTYMAGPTPVEGVGEGTLWPETYRFTRGTRRADIIARMRQDHARITARMWENRPPQIDPDFTLQEWVTLASIVEKETGQPDERPRVAAVFLNRLKKGMKLQSDPTVIYALTDGTMELGRPLLYADLEKTRSPYNTYLYAGLPPGPIANPGRASLEAVLSPAVSDDLYFVADGTGGHAFAKTLAEHNRNVGRWRAVQKTASP